jgi:glycerophosphoryl diester phosphodiesterase
MRVDEALNCFPAQKFNLDLKCEAAVDAFVAIMDSTGAYDRVLASSFSDDRLQRVRKRLGPRLVTSAGPREVGKFLAGSWGLRHRTSGPLALQIPSSIKGVPVVTGALVRHAHERGLHVHVWTIDDPTEMTRLLELGVDGLMTDRPSALKDLLVDRGTWSGIH